MPSHRIRLRAPWQCRRAGQQQVWTRRFGRPTGLDSGDRLTLVVDGLAAEVEVALNGIPLIGAKCLAGRREFDLAGLLLARNELTLRTSEAVEPCEENGPPCEISLRIDSADPPA